MFVKMHRIRTQKTCHLFSATVFDWLRVSQSVIRGEIDSYESQREPLRREEMSLTVWMSRAVARGHTSASAWLRLDEVRPPSTWRLEQQPVSLATSQASHSIMNVLFHSADAGVDVPIFRQQSKKCFTVQTGRIIRSSWRLQYIR